LRDLFSNSEIPVNKCFFGAASHYRIINKAAAVKRLFECIYDELAIVHKNLL
jgi:hypothetical protein